MQNTARTISHDEDFWCQAYRDHASGVLAFVRRRGLGKAEAEDLLHEVFVRAIRAGSFRSDGNLRSYLLSIARNLMIDSFRRPRLVLVPDPRDDGFDPLDHVADAAEGPEEQAQWADFGRAFTRALAALTESHRKAFTLAVLQGCSYEEIAELEGWSLSQVKVNIHRARRKLVAQLGDRIPTRPPADPDPGT